MGKPILNLAEAPVHKGSHGDRFEYEMRELGEPGAEIYPVRAHDYIVNLPGAADLAHQLVNTGTTDLVYLALSTARLPDVVGYPDQTRPGCVFRTRWIQAHGSSWPIPESSTSPTGTGKMATQSRQSWTARGSNL